MAVLESIKNVLKGVMHYTGEIGNFTYDPDEFKIENDGEKEYLQYVGKRVHDINIPFGVVELYKTFDSNREIESVIIPQSVQRLGFQAFRECFSLRNLKLSDSVVEIGDYCFQGCKGLSHVAIPNSVKVLGVGSFQECSNLKDVEIPDSVKFVKDFGFYDCRKLKKVLMHKNISIGKSCFEHCPAVFEYRFDGVIGKFQYDINNFIVERSEGNEYLQYIGIDKNVEIPTGLTKMYMTFSDVDVASVRIPDTVVSVSDYSFSNCRSIQAIKIPSSVKELGKFCFSSCSNLKSIEMSDSVLAVRYHCFEGCTSLQTISLSESIERLEEGCFYYCINLREIELPKRLRELCDFCFSDCEKLEYVKIPMLVRVLGKACFANCINLKKILLPRGISMGEDCFKDCPAELVYY